MLTARPSRLRDWALFGAAALLPALAVGVLGLRALANEEAGAQREVALGLEAAAERVSREIEQGSARAAVTLGSVTIAHEPEAAAGALRRAVPRFAEPVLLASDRAILVPAAPGRGTGSEARPGTALAPGTCRGLATSIATPPPRDEARVAADRRSLLAGCPDVRTPSGRFLWPVIALDAVPRGEIDRDAIASWIEAHATRLGEAEREATRIEVERVLTGEARDRATRALSSSWSRRDAVAMAIAGPGAAALRTTPDTGGIVTWRAGSSMGTLRAIDDGRLAGFVIDRASLESALGAGALAVPEGMRAVVVEGPPPEKTEPRLAATAVIAPDLLVRVVPADPDAVARRAARSRRALGALGAFATVGAFAMAALLFARMRAARRSSALRTDFVAAVSHELRTPIASMRMLAELLEEGRVEPEEHREVFEALAREARRLGETVDRLLGFSRMAAGRYVIDRREEGVAAVVATAVDTFEDRNPEMVKVERALDEEVRASIDAGQIRLAIDNLLANAKKYAPEGTPYRVSVRREAGGVAITVADRGPGIARRDRERIFEPFERADDRLSRATEGSGIGLSLVRHVARAHGGRAFVESDPGRGARFTIWIP